MKNEELVPKIRFQGFTDPWEQRKLKDVATFFDDQRIPIESGHRETGKYPYYGATGIIDMISNYIFDGEYVLLAEDGANITARTSPITYLTSGKFWLNNHAHIMKSNDGSNLFLQNQLERLKYNKYNTGTAQPKLNAKIVQNIELSFPEITEQNKIGQILNIISHLIAANEDKVKQLKELKKLLMQKIFSQEWRFKGFTDPWEQRKWANLIDISTDMVDPRNPVFSELPHIGPGNIESFSGQLLNNVNTVEKDHLISGKFHFHEGSIIYGKINPQLAKYIWANCEGLSSADTYVLTTKSISELNQGFIFYILQTRNFYKYSVSVSMRTGMPKINRSELDAYSFLCPQSQEQIKIVRILQALDHLIAANEDKVDQLKRTKQFLMQNLFI